jgi:exopolysaccharide production protein ExoQ
MWKHLEKIFTVFALLFCAGAFAALLTNQSGQVPEEKPQSAVLAAIQKQTSSENSDPTQAKSAMLVAQIVVYSVVAVLLIIHRRQALLYLRNTKLLWAIVALAFVSVLWSDVPGFALRRCVNLAATSGFGLYLAVRYSPRELLRLLGWTVIVAVVCSIVVVLLRPDLGIDTANEAWRGIFVQKNTLGRLMVLGALVFLFLAVDSKEYRRAHCVAAVLCGGMILAARSATSALAVPVLFVLIWLFARARQRSLARVFVTASLAVIGIACALMLFADTSDFMALVGRDTTLTGRQEIWSVVLTKIMAHPWLGYGYSSFWLGMEGQSSADVWAILRWPVPHSHNGFLDLTEELGVVGLGLFLVGLVVSARCGLYWARSQQAVIGLWPLAYLAFMVVFNLSEGSILHQDNILWVLYIATSVFIVNEVKHLLPDLSQALVRAGTSLIPGYAQVRSAKESVGM